MRKKIWLASDDPEAMLARLPKWISERKRFLLACACCRRVWRLLSDSQARRLVVLAERFADGLIGYGALEEAFEDWDGADPWGDLVEPDVAAGGAVGELVSRTPLAALSLAAEALGRVAGQRAIRGFKDDQAVEWPDAVRGGYSGSRVTRNRTGSAGRTRPP